MKKKKPIEIIENKEIFGDDIIPFLVEVKLLKGTDSFLSCIETLQRIGYTNNKTRELFQICFILHKKGKYYIIHHRLLDILDGKENFIIEKDIHIQNSIALLLEEWNMIKIINKDLIIQDIGNIRQIKILRHCERKNWKLIPLYRMKGNYNYGT